MRSYNVRNRFCFTQRHGQHDKIGIDDDIMQTLLFVDVDLIKSNVFHTITISMCLPFCFLTLT